MTTQEQYYFPASYAQQRLWILDRLEPGNIGYNVTTASLIEGDLNSTALHRSINEIIRRHETLRTRFGEAEGTPVQIINANQDIELEREQVRTREEAEARAKAEARREFDLGKGPLIRAMLLKISDREHLLVIVMHHIISDGWSMGVFYKELAALYEAYCDGKESPLAELEIQYADYAEWQRNWLSGDVLERQVKYWTEQLEGAPPVIDLPTDFPRPAVQTYNGGSRRIEVPDAVRDALKRLSREEGTTLFMTLLGTFNTLLYRYSDQKDMVIGTPIANRNRVEIEELIGYFANTLAMRTRLDGDPSFRELLTRVKDVAMGAYANQDVPFEKLVEELQPERDLSRSPLFQVLFVLQNEAVDELRLAGLDLKELRLSGESAKFDLSLGLSETKSGLQGVLRYNSDLFKPTTINRMAAHYLKLLEAIAADPNAKMSGLEMLGAQEKEEILAGWNQTERDYPSRSLIHQLFENQVEKTPQSIAIVFENKSVTYDELNRSANQLAHYLIKHGAGPETLIGICLERSIEMAAAMLGVLKAGAAYVPLDPAYPKVRLGFMLEDASARVLITQQCLSERIPEHQGKEIVIEREREKITQESEENPGIKAWGDNLAYVIYTSGSTGKPKGVAIRHSSAAAFLNWAQQDFDDNELPVILASTSICFDLSIYELFLPLSLGAKIVLAQNALSLPGLPARNQVTLINTVPSAIRELLQNNGVPNTVTRINLAGEALQRSLVQEIYDRSTATRVFNYYGPSEDTTYSTYALIPKGESGDVTIGRPIANTQAYVVNHSMNLNPVGVIGELVLAGEGLARGYLNRPDLTAERFVPNPFSRNPGERMYRTGDLVRYAEDGAIGYIGRADQQVKIRGYRIETGEIEAGLKNVGVKDAVVLAKDERGDKRLIAYIVEEETKKSEVKELKRKLRELLPEYMVPSVIVKVDEIPLTANGKVDKRALESHAGIEGGEREFVEARTPVEEIVAGIWRDVLKKERVSIEENFFDIGGHSLLATRVISKVRKELNVEVPLQVFFRRATIAELSEAVEEIQKSGAGTKMSGIFRLPRESHGGRGDVDRSPAFVEREEGSLGD